MTAEKQQRIDSLNIYSPLVKSAGLHILKQHDLRHYRLGLGMLGTSDCYPSTAPLTAEVARDHVGDEAEATDHLAKLLSQVIEMKGAREVMPSSCLLGPLVERSA